MMNVMVGNMGNQHEDFTITSDGRRWQHRIGKI